MGMRELPTGESALIEHILVVSPQIRLKFDILVGQMK
jgi:hypothetical protein